MAEGTSAPVLVPDSQEVVALTAAPISLFFAAAFLL